MASKAVHVFNKLVVGGVHYLFVKAVLDLLKLGSADGKEAKAALLTFGAFFSLFMVGLPIYLQERDRRYTWRCHGLAMIPGMLEWIAMYLSNTGNSSLPATIMIFMKATRVLWSALLTRFALKRDLYGFHWLGVLLTFVGLGPVMFVECLGSTSNSASVSEMVVPFVCVLACEFIRAIILIFEERLLQDRAFSPSFLQYVEGYIGVIISVIALITLQLSSRSGRPIEDTVNSLQTLWHNKYCLSYFIVHCSVYGVINYSNNMVTKLLSSVHNSMISQMRIMVVWVPEFIIGWAYATYQLKGILYEGKTFQLLKLIDIPGFAIIATSAFIYSGKLRLPIASLYPREFILSGKLATPPTTRYSSS